MFQKAHIVHGEYLNSVTMSIAAEGGGGAEITPYDGFPVEVEFAMSIGVTVNGPGIPYKQPFETDSFDLIANLYFSGDVYDSTVGGSLDFGPPADVSPTEGYAEYIGPGLVDIPVSVSEDSDVCYSYDASLECHRYFDWTLTLTYDIGGSPSPAAEPSTLPLLAGGLGLLGLLYHRTTRRTAVGL